MKKTKILSLITSLFVVSFFIFIFNPIHASAMTSSVVCNGSQPQVYVDWSEDQVPPSQRGDVWGYTLNGGSGFYNYISYPTQNYTDTGVSKGSTYTYYLNEYWFQTSISIPSGACTSAPRSADFTVNGGTSIIATFDTYLDFEGKQQGNVGCDLNLYRQDNSYAGPYKRSGGAGVSFGGLNADGTTQLTFSGQDGTFNSSNYGLSGGQPEPYGGYNFVLKCSDGSGVDLVRSVYVDFSAPAPANITVTGASSCSSAGLTWNLTPGNISGSYPSGSYSVTPSSGGTTYTLSPTVSSSYTYSVANSDGGQSSMLVSSGQNKSFTVSCVANPCPPSQSTTVQCPSGYTGTYTQTTTYSPAPSCPATVTDNSSTACTPNVGTPLPACRVDSFPAQSESGGVVSPTWATSYSNNVVLSGGQFGSGVAVEPDGSRAINISSNTLLTITANAGSTCSPSASASAWMYAETTPPPPPPSGSCNITYFPDDGEGGSGWAYPQWTSDANTLTLSGGPFNNTSVPAPNHAYYESPTVRMAIDTNTVLTLSGNGGQCTDTAVFYAAPPPPAPPNFTATPQGCGTGQIYLSWGISAGAGGYILYRDGAQIMNQPVNSFTDSGLVAGSSHSYTVIGTSPNGNTAPSSLSATAPAACAVAPTVSVSASPTSVAYNSGSTLSWTSTNATSCTASGGSTGWANGANARGTAGTFQTGNLTTTTTYTYTLTCTGPGGTSAPASASVTVGIAPPATPTGFTVTPTSCGNNWLNLSWNPSSGATNYKVYRDGGATPIYNGSGSDILVNGGPAMGFSDAGLAAGSSHNYTVTASNAGGTSVPASASGIVTASCTPTASISANPVNVAYNSGSTITWSSVNATSCTASGGSTGWANGANARGLSGSFPTGNLIANTTYDLTCTNAGINSTPVSTTVTVGAAPMSGTLTPQTTSCVIASGNSSCNINFSWSTTNPIGTSVVTKPVNVTVASGNNGTNVPFAVKYSSESFYLYNNGVELANSTVSSSCASGSSWNGSICYSAPAFDYSISSPTAVTVTKGDPGGATRTVSTTLLNGSSQPISIINTTPSMPTGLSVIPSTCTPSGIPCTSTLSIVAGSTATAGNYSITISGSPLGATTQPRTLSVTIANPTGITVTCSVNKATANVGESVSWSSLVSGGIQPYTTYTWSGSGVPSPAPTGSSFSTTYSTTGTKTAQVTVTDSAGAQGTCTPKSMQVNFDPTIIEF